MNLTLNSKIAMQRTYRQINWQLQYISTRRKGLKEIIENFQFLRVLISSLDRCAIWKTDRSRNTITAAHWNRKMSDWLHNYNRSIAIHSDLWKLIKPVFLPSFQLHMTTATVCLRSATSHHHHRTSVGPSDCKQKSFTDFVLFELDIICQTAKLPMIA